MSKDFPQPGESYRHHAGGPDVIVERCEHWPRAIPSVLVRFVPDGPVSQPKFRTVYSFRQLYTKIDDDK